jgi:prephenate dehydrogenase
MKIVVSGLGVIGASLALAVKQRNRGYLVAGYDRPDVLDFALKNQIIDQKINNWPQDASDADLIILSTPLSVIKEQLSELNNVVDKHVIVSDTGSTKAELAEHAASLNFSGTYIGGHPMTGSEKSGVSAANPLLFQNALYVLCGMTDDNEKLVKEKLFPVLEAVKARIFTIDADTHDKVLASISHLPQLLAVALVNYVGQEQSETNYPFFEMAAGGFRDLTRIASSSVSIWQDIINSNRKNVVEALDKFARTLENEKLEIGDLSEIFKKANNFRSQVPKDTKGFLYPLVDILVYVKDEVGVISKIANKLAEYNIDIRDIELLKIREKEGGVFRLSLNDRAEAVRAAELMNTLNYRAFIRE